MFLDKAYGCKRLDLFTVVLIGSIHCVVSSTQLWQTNYFHDTSFPAMLYRIGGSAATMPGILLRIQCTEASNSFHDEKVHYKVFLVKLFPSFSNQMLRRFLRFKKVLNVLISVPSPSTHNLLFLPSHWFHGW